MRWLWQCPPSRCAPTALSRDHEIQRMSWVGNLMISLQEIPKGCCGLLQTAAPVAQWLLYSPTPKLGLLWLPVPRFRQQQGSVHYSGQPCTTECAQTTGQHRWEVGIYLHLHGCIGLLQTWTVWAAQCCSPPAAAQDWSLLEVCIYAYIHTCTHIYTHMHTPVADLSHSISPVAGLRSLLFQLFASAHLSALRFADLYTHMQSQEFPENCLSSVGVEAMEFLFH